jgi:hypothetical protein
MRLLSMISEIAAWSDDFLVVAGKVAVAWFAA